MRRTMLRGMAGWAAGVALAAIAVLGAGCGGGPEKPREIRLHVVLTGAQLLNTCGGEFSNALVVRVYQLASDARISIAHLDQLSENESRELGEDLLEQQEVVLEPGGTLDLTVVPRPEAKVLAVVGNFCETRGDCWRWVRPLTGLKERTVLRFSEFCIEQP